MNVSDRLKYYIHYKNLTVAEFERIVGLSNGTVDKMTHRTRESTYNRLSKAFSDLNIEWLRFGEGNMLLSEEAINVRKIQTKEQSGAMVRFFSVTPTATFKEFYSKMDEKADYIQINNIDGEKIDKSSCIFEIYGESMAPQIQDHSKVLCREVSPTRWHQLHNCVVVIAYADRFVIKRIVKNRLDSENYLILESDNPDYPGQETVQLCDIRCIYKAQRIISQQII